MTEPREDEPTAPTPPPEPLPPKKQQHPKDPLHGVNLETILTRMVERHGWDGLAQKIPVRCFMFDPTITSSLKFLRRTPWARERLEGWYAWESRP